MEEVTGRMRVRGGGSYRENEGERWRKLLGEWRLDERGEEERECGAQGEWRVGEREGVWVTGCSEEV